MGKDKRIKGAMVAVVILTMLAVSGCALFNTPPEIASLTSSESSVARGGSCSISCTASDPNGDTLTYEWTASDGNISGEGSTVTWEAPTDEGTYTISVTASDGKGGTTSDSLTISVANTPPEIASLTSSEPSVARGGSCSISCAASDPNGDTLTYEWTASDGNISGEGSTVTWEAPTDEGTYTISVTVSDGKGGTTSDSLTISVANTPPEIASLTSSEPSVAPEESCSVSCTASDPDGDTLTYEWTASDGNISGEGSTVTWEAPTDEGTYTISVTVSDGKGGTTSDSLTISVEMKFGSIDIKSDPAGANVYLDGEDTGDITPYIITNVTPGSHTIKLEFFHYKYREKTITVNADETTYINWSLTYAPEETLTIQPDAADGKDATVGDSTPSTNLGDQSDLVAGSRGMGVYRAYLQFNLASVPDDAVILNAKLGLYYYYNVASSVETTIGAYIVQGNWKENTITWDNQPVVATTPEYTYPVPGSPTNAFVYWYIGDLVKGWWDESISNYGVLLRETDEDAWTAWKSFYSSDWGNAGQRPKLVINYYDPAP